MSYAIKKIRDYLAKSPSVIYPEDVLKYLPAIEAENAKLREMLRDYKRGHNDGYAEAMSDAGLEQQTLHDLYYAEGYSDGHTDAWAEASIEMKRIRDCLRAILDRGEAPAHVMSDE